MQLGRQSLCMPDLSRPLPRPLAALPVKAHIVVDFVALTTSQDVHSVLPVGLSHLWRNFLASGSMLSPHLLLFQNHPALALHPPGLAASEPTSMGRAPSPGPSGFLVLISGERGGVDRAGEHAQSCVSQEVRAHPHGLPGSLPDQNPGSLLELAHTHHAPLQDV